jgi:Carboxypeptidase regulatory-like domain
MCDFFSKKQECNRRGAEDAEKNAEKNYLIPLRVFLGVSASRRLHFGCGFAALGYPWLRGESFRPMRRCIIPILALIFCSPLLGADEHDTIVIDLKRNWEPSGFTASGVKLSAHGAMNLSGEFPKFSSNDPGRRSLFVYEFNLPIELSQYPTFTLKYRAHNIDTNNTLTCIWIIEGDTLARFPLIDFDKLTVDDKPHEIQVDLPSAPVDSTGTPFQNGQIHGIFVGVMNAPGGEGSIELLDMSFASADKAAQAAQVDQPIHVRVVDPKGQPVKGAALVVDAERKSAARSATTDSDGLATITPIKNELDEHAIEVNAPELVSITRTIDGFSSGTLEISPPKGMQVGGFIQDETGKPIGGALVSVYVNPTQPDPDPLIHARRSVAVMTNDKGQWLSPPLPETDDIYIGVAHPDYPGNGPIKRYDDLTDELKSGIATIVLKK